MKAIIQADLIQQIVKIARSVNEEFNFEFSEKGLRLISTDPSQISLVECKISKDAFNLLVLEDKKEIIGMDVMELSRRLSSIGKNAELILEKIEDKLKIQAKEKGLIENIEIPIIEVAVSNLSTLNLNYPVKIELEGKDLLTGLKKCAKISHHVWFSAGKNAFFLNCESSLGKARIKLVNSTITVFEGKENQALLPCEYILDFCKTITGKMTLGLKTNNPIMLEYQKDQLEVVYYLAPRIEDTQVPEIALITEQSSTDQIKKTANDPTKIDSALVQPVKELEKEQDNKQQAKQAENNSKTLQEDKEVKEKTSSEALLTAVVEFKGKNKEWLVETSKETGIPIESLIVQAVNNDRLCDKR